MPDAFDRDSWERRWSRALRDGAHAAELRPPNAQLAAVAADLPTGRALDAGAGHGTEAIWLARRGWQVTAVDFSATALEHGHAAALRVGPDLAQRVTWEQGDLATWSPPAAAFDLVSCLYVHVAGTIGDLVRRLVTGVAPGGTLLLVGHRPVDPATGAPTAASGQVQVSVDAVLPVLDPGTWEVRIAQDRPRSAAGTGVDAVVCAHRRA